MCIRDSANSTQNPNEREIFKRLEEQTNVHVEWTCFVEDQFNDKKNLAMSQAKSLPDGLFNAGMSNYDLLRYATVSYTHLDVYKRQHINNPY